MRQENLLILLIIIFGCKQLKAQYTSIPDPQFENYLENNGMGDGIANNGLVLTANIENVTELIIFGQNITSLAGIEDFQALELLGCSDNPIAEVDLSQNTNLQQLAFVHSLLTSLDLSSLENLTGLHLNLNLLLTTLTLGNKPDLSMIEAFENALTTMDLSQCPELVKLWVHNNHLTTLDISHNQKLFELWYGINPLEELDTSNNPELGVLNGSYTNITHFDFSQNPNLYAFTEGHNNALTFVDMRNGNNESMEFFAITQCFNFKCIYVDDISAPYLEDWHIDTDFHFVHNEEECDALTTHEIFDNQLTIYPNPVKENLIVENPDLKITGIKVTDLDGKLILSKKLNSIKAEIDFSSFPKGFYFILIESGDNTIKKKKIIKN